MKRKATGKPNQIFTHPGSCFWSFCSISVRTLTEKDSHKL
jgi:hypothetical protein